MVVKRRQKDDNHGTWEDKLQGPLVSDKRREIASIGGYKDISCLLLFH